MKLSLRTELFRLPHPLRYSLPRRDCCLCGSMSSPSQEPAETRRRPQSPSSSLLPDPRIVESAIALRRRLRSLSPQTFRRSAPAYPKRRSDPLHSLASVLLAAEWLIDGEREIRDRLAGRCGPHLRIPPGIPEENDLVYSDARHDDVCLHLSRNFERCHETADWRKRTAARPESVCFAKVSLVSVGRISSGR